MNDPADGVRHGVVAVIERDGRWLMIRRGEGVIAPGYWCFPGGGIEAGETPELALVREIREEIGMDVRPERVIFRWQRPDGKLMLEWWRASFSDERQEPRLSPDEVAEIRWVTLAELKTLRPALESNHIFLEHFEKVHKRRSRG
ncbi:MAG TPA: NUDIX domain-containing protein [Phycisphaerae bacterium]|nr:NUDIX domain-containing protein [Phycisphaerae bacterium]HRR85861.1 NUDIX domain-containing protein [Phycisphaerae bacterium]